MIYEFAMHTAYGTPLALFRLCSYVRTTILGDEVKLRQPFPEPTRRIYQQGNLILEKTQIIPEGAVKIQVTSCPDGSGGPLGEKDFNLLPEAEIK